MEHHEISVFTWVLEKMGLHAPDHIVMATVIALFLMAATWYLTRNLRLEKPSRIQVGMEEFVKGYRGLVEEVIGQDGRPYLAVTGMFLLFVLLANLSGLVPGLQPPTGAYSVPLALAIISFVYYNALGVAKHGPIAYLRHFAGPMMALAILIFPVEIISHTVRMLSLSMRLFGNISGEHTASGVFYGLVGFPVLYPIFLMALGLIASTLQAFIFCVLSIVYVGGAVGEEH